ncbi:MAG: GNAT family N-acetyltransferase [Thermoanaerobaculum sp.]|nr:GNAT family N-acetyltransferase [Thermoanaerobaculum sp.]
MDVFGFNIRPTGHDEAHLVSYSQLLSQVFGKPKKFTVQYLRWLYLENPHGPAVGFDAWQGSTLAAHYTCVPVKARFFGEVVPALLSLNTATAPQFRGRGLFPQLAKLTYARGRELGAWFVLGVGNRQSTKGLVSRLGFVPLGPLIAAVGLGNQPRLAEPLDLQLFWDEQSLAWRQRNPSNPVWCKERKSGTYAFFARTHIPYIFAYCELPISWQPIQRKALAPPLRVFLGLVPCGRVLRFGVSIPLFLRPSPLNLTFLPLREGMTAPARNKVFWTFLDFDAF